MNHSVFNTFNEKSSSHLYFLKFFKEALAGKQEDLALKLNKFRSKSGLNPIPPLTRAPEKPWRPEQPPVPASRKDRGMRSRSDFFQ